MLLLFSVSYIGSLMKMNQNYYFLLIILLILYLINDYVTDVVVTWSDVIDQLYYFLLA